MKFIKYNSGFILFLTRRDTARWARGETTGKSWPCSELAWHALRVEYNAGGLVEFKLNSGQTPTDNVQAEELMACVYDHVKDKLPETNPAYFVAITQAILKTVTGETNQNLAKT